MEHSHAKHPAKFKAFKALFVARSDYGKSYLIADFILDLVRQKHVEPKRILVFSKTYKTDDSQQRYITVCEQVYGKFSEKNCFETIDMGTLTRLYDGQKKIKEDGKPLHHYLVVLDDMISESILSGKGPFVSMYSLMRHYNISVILSLQAYRSTMGSVLRNQVTLLAVGALSSASATEDILTEVDGGLAHTKRESFRIISQWYHDALRSNQGHGFLVVDMTASPWEGKKYRRNFDKFWYDTAGNRTE